MDQRSMRGISTSAKRGRIGMVAVNRRQVYGVRNVGQFTGQLGVWDAEVWGDEDDDS
jgi:hypothetical protein